MLTPLRSPSTTNLVAGGSKDDVVGLVTHAGTCSASIASIASISDGLQRAIAARDP